VCYSSEKAPPPSGGGFQSFYSNPKNKYMNSHSNQYSEKIPPPDRGGFFDKY
jgi:hypothetical protein